MLSLVYGNAFEVADAKDTEQVRIYRADGRTFIGYETEEIAHVCNHTCAQVVIAEDNRWTLANDNGGSYVDIQDHHAPVGMPSDQFSTLDVQSFDPGEDPYVTCAACGNVLVRNDEAYEAMFGVSLEEVLNRGR